MVTYLDNASTTPVNREVQKLVASFFEENFGNAGSRTHEFGSFAKKAVLTARQEIAQILRCEPDDVVFTSGATESNNLAILGLVGFGEQHSRKHIISSEIEHKAVLEPLEYLEANGFEVELIPPNKDGQIQADDIKDKLRPETLLVSVMQVNNETGIEQPIAEICDLLSASQAFFHVDAAQGFGKRNEVLKNQRIDLISLSGHKIYAPMGIGSLVMRKREGRKLPIKPIMFGGGQEGGLRPGTLPVPLIAGFGLAATIANEALQSNELVLIQLREKMLKALESLKIKINGNPLYGVPNIVSLSIPDVDAEAAMVVLKDLIAVSNGSACTSSSYRSSHVLEAMKVPSEQIETTVRISWSPYTEEIDWKAVLVRLKSLQG